MTADLLAILDQLDEARAKATPGVWKLWGMDVMADVDGTSNVDTALRVAHTTYRDDRGMPRTFDAALICDMHRALPKLTAALRAVLALANEQEAEGAATVDNLDDWVRGRAHGITAAADWFRSAITAALTPEATS